MLKTTLEPWDGERRVRVARVGVGPPLVFLHGYPDNLQVWAQLVPRLADRWTCIAFDWPGLGHSDPVPGGATPTHLADRLARLLDRWGIAKAGVVGLDMGGQPALAFAAKHADRTAGVVVMNSLVMHDARTSWEIRLLRKLGFNRLVLRWLPGLVFRRALATFVPAGVSLPAELRADLWSGFRRPEVRKMLAKMCAGYQGTLPRLAELYPQIRRPVLVLWAERDAHFPLEHAERLHALIPGSELAVLAGAGHWMVWDRAEEVAERMRPFLERVGQGAEAGPR